MTTYRFTLTEDHTILIITENSTIIASIPVSDIEKQFPGPGSHLYYGVLQQLRSEDITEVIMSV